MTRYRPLRSVWLLALGLAAPGPLPAAEPTLQRDGAVWRFGNGLVELTFAADSGRLTSYGRPGAAPAAADAGLTLLLEGGGGVTPATAVALEGLAAEPGAATVAGPVIVGAPDSAPWSGTAVSVTTRRGAWRVVERWRLWPDSRLAARTTTWTNLGAAPATVTGVRGHLSLQAPTAASELVLPSSFPVETTPVAAFTGRQRSVALGGQTAQLVVLRDPRADEAVLALTAGEAEYGSSSVTEQAGAVRLEQTWPARLVAEPGRPFEVGAQFVGLSQAGLDAIAETAWEAFDRVGHRVPADPAPDLDRAVLFSAHVRGSIGSGFRDTGGFAAFTKRLPQLAAMGYTIVWLLPFWKGPVYAPTDYHQVDPACGTEAELKALVTEAHRLGLRVIGDLVPHGPREESGLLAEHPEWVTRHPDGTVTYTWGCLQCDYAHPGWQRYMADHAVDWMRRVGLDGYRVDVAGGGPPNWRATDGRRPSLSGISGARRLLATVRAAMKRQDPRSLLLMEGTSPGLCESGDLIYDFPWAYTVLPGALSLPWSEWSAAAAGWLDWQRALYPRGARLLRYAESHDTVKAAWRYGPALHQRLLAVNALIPGVPMVYDGEEAGAAGVLRQVFARRAAAPADDDPFKFQAAEAAPPAAPPATGPVTVDRREGRVVVRAPAYELVLDPARGGAIAAWLVRGRPLITGSATSEGQRKLFLGTPPIDFDAQPAEVTVTAADSAQVVRCALPSGPAPRPAIARQYRCFADRVDCQIELTPAVTIERAASTLTTRLDLGGATAWAVETADGRLGDAVADLLPRQPVGASFRYRHEASCNLWEAKLFPLFGDLVLSGAGGARLVVRDLAAEPAEWCQNARLEAVARDQSVALRLAIDWLDGGAVSLPAGRTARLGWTLATTAAPTPPPPPAPQLTGGNGNYTVENDHYRLVLGRSSGGSIRELRRRTAEGWGPNLVRGLNTYTDAGLYGDWNDPAGRPQRTRAFGEWDLEPDVSIRRDGDRLRVAFLGVVRGSYGNGLHVQRPFTWYRHEYVCDRSPTITLQLGLRPRSGYEFVPVEAFAAHTLSLAEVRRWTAAGGDGQQAGAAAPASAGRVWQAKEHGGLTPAGFTIEAAGGRLRIGVPAGSDGLQNAFPHDSGAGQVTLFFAPFDFAPTRIAPTWHELRLALEVQP